MAETKNNILNNQRWTK